ncbi:hypothetical protein [Rhodohalobacter sp.]|uniref:hypothetical protein n=1 Tax=Rhodohalobacter sp. TaxID=1974210 RepID=UPI002ACDDD7F|nr:hypothetical protein [Rhodohalobacter sp.]MDZ7756774.1 hypothetical protein [Rhodohalobacter sp.]
MVRTAIKRWTNDRITDFARLAWDLQLVACGMRAELQGCRRRSGAPGRGEERLLNDE